MAVNALDAVSLCTVLNLTNVFSLAPEEFPEDIAVNRSDVTVLAQLLLLMVFLKICSPLLAKEVATIPFKAPSELYKPVMVLSLNSILDSGPPFKVSLLIPYIMDPVIWVFLAVMVLFKPLIIALLVPCPLNQIPFTVVLAGIPVYPAWLLLFILLNLTVRLLML